MTMDLLVNARFTTRPMSGVDRVADEMVRALFALAEELGAVAPRIQLAAPRADRPEGREGAVAAWPIDHRGRLPGHAWEQFELPRLAPDAWLYSPCNAGPLMRRRQIVTLHDAQARLTPEAYTPAFRLWCNTLMPRLARRARLVTTVSQFSKTQLERFGIVPAGKAQVIPNGADHILRVVADPAAPARHGLVPGGYVLAIGNLSPHKNLALLLRAAAKRPAGAPPLAIAGGGNPRLYAGAGIEPGPGVRILGRIGDPELKALYESALALAFPSRTEGFGLPPVEAMLCGCPVVASTGGAIPETCGEAALYADPDDEGAWTVALMRVADDAGLRTRLAQAGRERGRLFTWRAAAVRFLAALARADGDAGLAEALAGRDHAAGSERTVRDGVGAA